jgi:hypothetical protein
MTLLQNYKEQKKLEQARIQPYLWFTPFPVLDVLEQVRSEHFPELSGTVRIYCVNRGPLACVVGEDSSATVYMHQLLNHNDTPVEVVSTICKHELLHIRIPPVVEGKRTIQHPPAFWEEERAMAPERSAAWIWIWINLGSYLKKRPRLERIDVLCNWRERWHQPMLDVVACRRLLSGATEEVEDVVW